MHVVGMVLHPLRDSAEAVDAVLGWAKRKGAQVLGIETEIRRLNCAAVGVTAGRASASDAEATKNGRPGRVTRSRAQKKASAPTRPVVDIAATSPAVTL